MWNLLKKSDEECGRLRDLLEDSSEARPEAKSIDELSEAWPAAQRNHLAACGICHTTGMSMAATPRMTRAHIAIQVFLRLTAMDVCCGPPSSF